MLSPYLGADIINDVRLRYLVFSEHIPRVSWDWYIDPKGPAFQVLYEFRNLGPSIHGPRKDYNSPDAMSHWPYFYPRWQSCRSISYPRSAKAMRSSFIKLFENRFERRWLKKMKKLERAHGIRKSPKIPGSWID
jgi:hypothetical protein